MDGVIGDGAAAGQLLVAEPGAVPGWNLALVHGADGADRPYLVCRYRGRDPAHDGREPHREGGHQLDPGPGASADDRARVLDGCRERFLAEDVDAGGGRRLG